MAYLLQQLANAVPLAALYAALAFGYAVAFGVTKRADITYGAIFAFAGQILLLFTELAFNRFWLVLPAALPSAPALPSSIRWGRAYGSVVRSCCRWSANRRIRSSSLPSAS